MLFFIVSFFYQLLFCLLLFNQGPFLAFFSLILLIFHMPFFLLWSCPHCYILRFLSFNLLICFISLDSMISFLSFMLILFHLVRSVLVQSYPRTYRNPPTHLFKSKVNDPAWENGKWRSTNRKREANANKRNMTTGNCAACVCVNFERLTQDYSVASTTYKIWVSVCVFIAFSATCEFMIYILVLFSLLHVDLFDEA